MPDTKARLQAIQLLLSESLGKAPMASEARTPTLPRTTAEAEAMPWKDMTYVFGIIHADELREVARTGGPRGASRKTAEPERSRAEPSSPVPRPNRPRVQAFLKTAFAAMSQTVGAPGGRLQ